MIVNMSANATEEQIQHVMDRIKECGFLPHLIQGAERTVIGVVGKNRGRRAEVEALRVAPGVDEVLVISQPYTLVSLELQPQRTVVEVRGVKIGGPDLVVIAGPCSVESREQLMETARGVKAAGAHLLRGEVVMEANFALEDDDVAAGFILTCQSYPTSDAVAIDLDRISSL